MTYKKRKVRNRTRGGMNPLMGTGVGNDLPKPNAGSEMATQGKVDPLLAKTNAGNEMRKRSQMNPILAKPNAGSEMATQRKIDPLLAETNAGNEMRSQKNPLLEAEDLPATTGATTGASEKGKKVSCFETFKKNKNLDKLETSVKNFRDYCKKNVSQIENCDINYDALFTKLIRTSNKIQYAMKRLRALKVTDVDGKEIIPQSRGRRAWELGATNAYKGLRWTGKKLSKGAYNVGKAGVQAAAATTKGVLLAPVAVPLAVGYGLYRGTAATAAAAGRGYQYVRQGKAASDAAKALEAQARRGERVGDAASNVIGYLGNKTEQAAKAVAAETNKQARGYTNTIGTGANLLGREVQKQATGYAAAPGNAVNSIRKMTSKVNPNGESRRETVIGGAYAYMKETYNKTRRNIKRKGTAKNSKDKYSGCGDMEELKKTIDECASALESVLKDISNNTICDEYFIEIIKFLNSSLDTFKKASLRIDEILKEESLANDDKLKGIQGAPKEVPVQVAVPIRQANAKQNKPIPVAKPVTNAKATPFTIAKAKPKPVVTNAKAKPTVR